MGTLIKQSQCPACFVVFAVRGREDGWHARQCWEPQYRLACVSLPRCKTDPSCKYASPKRLLVVFDPAAPRLTRCQWHGRLIRRQLPTEAMYLLRQPALAPTSVEAAFLARMTPLSAVTGCLTSGACRRRHWWRHLRRVLDQKLMRPACQLALTARCVFQAARADIRINARLQTRLGARAQPGSLTLRPDGWTECRPRHSSRRLEASSLARDPVASAA
jgi:hypothetical protein